MAHEQMMKPATAAKKLDVYLPATPTEFRTSEISRVELQELIDSPPEWLVELRRHGPHPRNVVAQRLQVSASGLARSGVSDSMTTDEIVAVREENPQWLVREQESLRQVVRDERRAERNRASTRAIRDREVD